MKLMLSCCHVFCRPYGKAVATDKLYAAVEALMLTQGGRPHWGKSHNLTCQQLRTIYKSFDRFIEVRNQLDPQRMFTNDYLKRVLGD